MQLNEIIESTSITEISDKTKISQQNIENLLALEFSTLSKVKTLGFISILEREYKIDLSGLKKDARSYYELHKEVDSMTFNVIQENTLPVKSIFWGIVVVLMIAVASWYFLTQLDKKQLKDLMPFMGEKTINSISNNSKKVKYV